MPTPSWNKAEASIIGSMGNQVAPPTDAQRAVDQLETFRRWFEDHGVDAQHGSGPVPRVAWVGAENAAYVKSNAMPKFIADALGGANGELFLIGRGKDGKSFAAADVLGHEFAHRITESYFADGAQVKGGFGGSGAVREHISDVFGQVLTGDRSGVIGEDLVQGGIRSMRRPNSVDSRYTGGLENPETAANVPTVLGDNGGVHLNVGPLNRAADAYQLKFGLEDLGDLYLHALQTKKIVSDTGFDALARAIWQSAKELHGESSEQAAFARTAFKDVGLDPAPLMQRMHDRVDGWLHRGMD